MRASGWTEMIWPRIFWPGVMRCESDEEREVPPERAEREHAHERAGHRARPAEQVQRREAHGERAGGRVGGAGEQLQQCAREWCGRVQEREGEEQLAQAGEPEEALQSKEAWSAKGLVGG